MSCDININLSANIHTAAIIRESLYRYTKEDSYEFPSQRVSAIREFIEQLDEQIAANLPDDHDH
jgi:hypothetical protein